MSFLPYYGALNMKRLVLGIFSLTACIPLLMAAVELPANNNVAMTATSATGEGSMSFGHENEGRAWLKFNIQDGEQPSGTMIFAAEQHHDNQINSMIFPDVIVRLTNFEKFTFKKNFVRFSGSGTLHDEPITISVIAYDNEGSKKDDRFVIKCMDDKGRVVFHADGFLFRGNIQIGGE